MNIFRTYTLRCLRSSPARTLVTIVGIVLSMVLFTAVLTGAWSGIAWLRQTEVDQDGAFHGYAWDLTPEEARSMEEDPALTATATWQDAGWALLNPESRAQPYLYLVAVSENFPDLVKVDLLEGRMPETASEILLPTDYYVRMGDPEWNCPAVETGQSVTFQVGRRCRKDGTVLGETEDADLEYRPEEVADAEERTFTVVGFYASFSYQVEQGRIPAAVALTGGGGTGAERVFFTLKDPGRFAEYQAQMEPRRISSHASLLRFYAVLGNELTALLWGFTAVLLFLVVFGSVALISSSFSISVSERIRQFGMLRTLGATGKQIRSAVFWEAFLLCGAGIPLGLLVGCGGMGVTLWLLRNRFAAFSQTGTPMAMAVHPLLLLLAALLCMGTILLSAWLPARKAAQGSAIEAIRHSGKAPRNAQKLRGGFPAGRLFGFPGEMAARNFRRDRRRYRPVVFSLFLSVMLFVSVASFTDCVKEGLDLVTDQGSREDLLVSQGVEPGKTDPDQVLSQLSQADGVTEGVFYGISYQNVFLNEGDLSGDCVRTLTDPEIPHGEILRGGAAEYTMHLIFLQDSAWRKLCEDSGLDGAALLQAPEPQALFYNRQVKMYTGHDSLRRWLAWDVLSEDAFPVQITGREHVEMEGCTLVQESIDAEGVSTCWYYPDDYLEEIQGADVEPDPSRAIVLSGDDAWVRRTFSAAAPIQEVPFALRRDAPLLIYPWSRIREVLEENLEDGPVGVTYCFRSEYPERTVASMAAFTRAMDQTDAPVLRKDSSRMLETLLELASVFSAGFVVLITLIAAANVFDIITTSMALRRREFAMLKSIGMGEREFRRMLCLECASCGFRGLFWGMLAAAGVSRILYRLAAASLVIHWHIPLSAMAGAVLGVFLMVASSMAYALSRLKGEDLMQVLKTETF